VPANAFLNRIESAKSVADKEYKNIHPAQNLALLYSIPLFHIRGDGAE
jgi:hypothetical protein